MSCMAVACFVVRCMHVARCLLVSQIGDIGADALLAAIPNSNLTTLICDHNEISEEKVCSQFVPEHPGVLATQTTRSVPLRASSSAREAMRHATLFASDEKPRKVHAGERPRRQQGKARRWNAFPCVTHGFMLASASSVRPLPGRRLRDVLLERAPDFTTATRRIDQR